MFTRMLSAWKVNYHAHWWELISTREEAQESKKVNSCCVVACTNRVGKKAGVSFYRSPFTDKEICMKWSAAAAIRRTKWAGTAAACLYQSLN